MIKTSNRITQAREATKDEIHKREKELGVKLYQLYNFEPVGSTLRTFEGKKTYKRFIEDEAERIRSAGKVAEIFTAKDGALIALFVQKPEPKKNEKI